MKRFKFDYDESDVYVSSDNYFPYYNDSIVFSHTSGGLLECMQIAYLMAILNRKKVDDNINHSGLIMLDTIGKYLGTSKTNDEDIKDPEVYKEIYNVLIEVANEMQIIVVDNTPPENATPYIKYTFYDDGRGLVDLNINHMNEEEKIDSF